MQMDDMEGPVTQLTIFLYDHKRDRAEPLYHQILKKAKEEGMKGVTVFRGIEGYGRQRRIHSTMLFETLQQLPFMILMIDTEHKINAFLPTFETASSRFGNGRRHIHPLPRHGHRFSSWRFKRSTEGILEKRFREILLIRSIHQERKIRYNRGENREMSRPI